jgi:hypothetical protein
MANPILNIFNNSPLGNMMNMVQQFNQFRNSFRGDPKQQVEQLLSSGQMSQGQFNQLQQMAQQFMGVINR